MIQDIEGFGQQLQVDSLRQPEPSTQTEIKRGEVKPTSRIAPDADRTIVAVRVEVAIVSHQHVERQTRRISEYVTHLKTAQKALEPGGFAVWWHFERAAYHETMALVVVGQAAIVVYVEVVLHA